jgi:hypothetical protein
MQDAEIFGVPSSALWSMAQALVAPALAFAFLYLMRLPLASLFFLPEKPKYKPPAWVLPLFAHGSAFALVGLLSLIVFLNVSHERELADDIRPELCLLRELDTKDKRLTKIAIVLQEYDGLSGLQIFANGYHVFSSNRDCVAKFQCKERTDTNAAIDAKDIIERRGKGFSIFELDRTNTLPHEIILNDYLAAGQNYLDLVSENSGTGACTTIALIHLETSSGTEKYRLSIQRHQQPGRVPEPKREGQLRLDEEIFYSGGPAGGDTVRRYNTSTLERGNVICERIRISLKLDSRQTEALSSDQDFHDRVLARHKAYVCETLYQAADRRCESRP